MTDRPAGTEFLIARVLRGDEEAFRQLLLAHRKTIEATLVAHGVRSREVAFDLAQDVALKVWQRLPELREPERFVFWLRQIAANAARDHFRRLAVRREESLEEAETIAAAGTPVDLAERRLAYRQMKAVLVEEGPETAQLLVARAEGAEVVELAARTGLTPAALKMRLSRARQRMRSRLARLRGEVDEGS